MQNNLHKVLKFFILFTAVISSWTSFVLLSNTKFDLEIKEIINQMYLNQKKFIYNIKDLSILLLKDANERFDGNNKDIELLNNQKIK